MNQLELRTVVSEFRADGRTLSGTLVNYGDVAIIQHPLSGEIMHERIAAGAFGAVDQLNIGINLRHQQFDEIARVGQGLQLRDRADRLDVNVVLPRTPEGDHVHGAVKRGELRGFSAEFRALVEQLDHRQQVRDIRRAELVGLALVDEPAYPQSRVEARRRGGAISGTIPYKRPLACQCVKGSCDRVQFQRSSFTTRRRRPDTSEADADLDGLDIDDAGDVLAIVGEYQGAIASRKRGTLILENTDDGLEVSITRLPETQAGRDLAEQAKQVPIYARPVFVEQRVEEIGGVVHVRSARLRAITFGPTDATEGWDPVRIVGVDQRTHYTSPYSKRRRLWR